MKSISTAKLAAATAAILLGIAARTQAAEVPVQVQPAKSVDIVVFTSDNVGRVVGRTNANGAGGFDIGRLANLPKMDVVQEQCRATTRVLLVVPGVSTGDSSCKQRRVGSFWWGHDEALNVTLSGGTLQSLTQPKTLAFIGAGGGVGTYFLTRDGQSTVIADDKTVKPDNKPEPITIDLSNLFGTFNITATKISDTGCNFSQSFGGQVSVTGNSDGSQVSMRVLERLTRAYLGTLKADGTFNGTGTGNLNGFGYAGTLSGQIRDNVISGNEVLTFNSGCPGKSVTYGYAGNKQ